jgi:hypothetical protein
VAIEHLARERPRLLAVLRAIGVVIARDRAARGTLQVVPQFEVPS